MMYPLSGPESISDLILGTTSGGPLSIWPLARFEGNGQPTKGRSPALSGSGTLESHDEIRAIFIPYSAALRPDRIRAGSRKASAQDRGHARLPDRRRSTDFARRQVGGLHREFRRRCGRQVGHRRLDGELGRREAAPRDFELGERERSTVVAGWTISF